MTAFTGASVSGLSGPESFAGESRADEGRDIPWPLLIAWGLALAVLAWLRLAPSARDTLWAEDGTLFLQSAAGHAQWTTLFAPYAGYLHLVPRLEAITTVDLVPVQWWALSMTALSCAVAGLVAVVVFVASRDLLPGIAPRLVVSGLTVLTPLLPREVLGNAANVHTLLFWGVFWVLLAAPRTRAGRIGYALFVLVSALTEIQTVFLLPLLLWNRRDRRTWPIKLALVVGVAGQFLAELLAPRGAGQPVTVGIPSLIDGWFINGILTSWVPIPVLGNILAASMPVILILALVPMAAVAVTTFFGTAAHRALAWILAGYSVLIWCAGVIVDPAPWYQYATFTQAELTHVWLSRYGVIPAMMLLAELPLAAVALVRSRSRPRRVAASVLIAAVVLTVFVQAPENLSRRDYGPAWGPQIAAAEQKCDRPTVTSVEIGETLGWSTRVPCSFFAGE
ncbi:hypothetical protein [Microbacterium candidum]|uniref:DUF2029 domain-containing protein n=1 Tax=Microbacterium candidum TaxID=3041922 RepID=A0ABT7MWH3_9MICO|nr:hypothetical protein [Microbacterium sp. ASV49]MDL9978798.1 hypothetical protein [Microbacterium sp. ASV49]